MRWTSVSVALPGPPPVIMIICVNTWNDPIVLRSTKYNVVGFNRGIVIWSHCLNLPAPSILAASYNDWEIDPIEAKYMMTPTPNGMRHCMMISAHNAVFDCPSQLIGSTPNQPST